MSVICLTGAPGAGKTTVAEALASRVPAGVHVPVDFFRKMVRAGYASPHHWSAEVERQYDLARRAAAATALTYATAGFVVVIDDIAPVGVVPIWRELLPGVELRFVLLDPGLDVALERNRARAVWTVDEGVLRDLHQLLSAARSDHDWIVIDNTDLAPAAAADRILAALA